MTACYGMVYFWCAILRSEPVMVCYSMVCLFLKVRACYGVPISKDQSLLSYALAKSHRANFKTFSLLNSAISEGRRGGQAGSN